MKSASWPVSRARDLMGHLESLVSPEVMSV